MGKRRWQILTEILPKTEIIGAEIGVFEGDTSAYLLENMPNLKQLICVDPFVHYPEHTKTLNPNKAKFHDADFDKVLNTFLKKTIEYSDRVKLIRKFSHQAAREIEDQSLDFVFIDGNHAYAYVREDIQVWGPKIKKGGVLAGHDWNVKGYKNAFGVNRAVRELLGRNFKAIRHVWYHRINDYKYFEVG